MSGTSNWPRGRRRAAAAAVAAVLLAGCSEPHPTLDDLKKTPGATATYPGAVEYQRGEAKAHNQVDGPSPASITVYACAHDSASTVQAFFERVLSSQGWRRDPSSHQDRPGAFVGGMSWVRGSARFDLSFDTRATADFLARTAHQPTGCPTGYQTLAQLG